MKVICSNDKWTCSVDVIGRPTPKYMEECFVVDEFYYFGHTYYELSGYNPDSLFQSTNFVIASDLLEKSLVNTKKEYA